VPVVGARQFSPEWLVQPADDDQQGLLPVLSVVVQAAEHPVMVTAGTIDADLTYDTLYEPSSVDLKVESELLGRAAGLDDVVTRLENTPGPLGDWPWRKP